MSYAERHTITLTTDADGNATGYIPVSYGKLSQIRYVKPVSGGFEDGVTFAITAEATGETLWGEAAVDASATVAPRQATHSTAGVAATFDGTRAVLDKIALAHDRIRIVVTLGGNGGVGTFHVVLE